MALEIIRYEKLSTKKLVKGVSLTIERKKLVIAIITAAKKDQRMYILRLGCWVGGVSTSVSVVSFIDSEKFNLSYFGYCRLSSDAISIID